MIRGSELKNFTDWNARRTEPIQSSLPLKVPPIWQRDPDQSQLPRTEEQRHPSQRVHELQHPSVSRAGGV